MPIVQIGLLRAMALFQPLPPPQMEGVARMLEPLHAAAAVHPELRNRLEIYQRRLDQQITAAPPCPDDQLTSSAIDGLILRTQNGHDSVYQLAMDLQWELNRLSGTVLPESIDGASTYVMKDEPERVAQAIADFTAAPSLSATA